MKGNQLMDRVRSVRYTCFWLIGTMLLILADQVTKKLAVVYLKQQGNISLISGILELQYLENQGMAFGLLKGRQFLFILFCIIFCVVLIYFFIKIPKTPYYRPLIIISGFLVSGATGNFIDRVVRGYVVDFIYFSLIDFPVFNVADIYVVCSCIALILSILFHYKDEDFYFIAPKSKG